MDDKQFKVLVNLLNDQYGKFGKRAEETEKNVANLVDKVYDRMDSVYKEVLDIRTEQAAHQAQHNDTEERLLVVESVPVVALDLKKSSKKTF